MGIEDRQKPREGSAFATYAHQRPPKSKMRVVLWSVCLIASVVAWGWLLKSFEWIQMEVDNLKKQLQLMKVLVYGCKKHPAYRAIRPATGNCEPCVKMWNARLELNKLEQ